jgi:hypothetical protein
MIRLENYPEVALDDVCRTTLKAEGYENEWGEPGLVSRNVMENLEVVLEMPMDEKIRFWQKVMRHAADRGIEVYWITWNICPNSVAPPVEPFYKTYGINMEEYAEGKHGITYQMDNPVTIDYYRKAVREFLLTYPEVKGIGVTAGEHMPLEWNGYNREKWLWETYGLGILDFKEEHPDREIRFIHRVWHSDMDQIMRYWKDYPDPFDVSFKFAKARLYSSPNQRFAEEHLREVYPYGLRSWWNLRNDDIFVYRWGDHEYVREFLANLPPEKFTAGYYMGSDGYVWGKEFISKDPGLSGQLEIEKHWYRFMLWGRLGYNNDLDRDFFRAKLKNHDYGDDAQGGGNPDEIRDGGNGDDSRSGSDDFDAGLLLNTWQYASRIIPLVNLYHWRDWDHHWSVESCQARPKLGGFRDVFDFVENPTHERSMFLNPLNFALQERSGDPIILFTPFEVRDSIRFYATKALTGIRDLGRKDAPAEYRTLLDDISAQAYLGNYYASKISAAVELARFQLTGDELCRQSAVSELEDAYQNWLEYATISSNHYRPQMLARTYMLDWNELSLRILEEIELLKSQ